MRILITAGPTREPIDPVRFLTNRSSGRMGYALAAAALERGHEAVLVSGPVCLVPPVGAHVLTVQTAREMFEAVRQEIGGCDIAIFAAAVSDYRPVTVSPSKIKKNSARITLELERTEDILGSARLQFGFQGILVGFAAETDDLTANARDKLTRKGCDLVIANDVSRPGIGFDSAENAVTLILPNGEERALPRQSKANLALALMDFMLALPPSTQKVSPN
jgi:phosphopantothenoylcysteine synthetase/decarboxylase